VLVRLDHVASRIVDTNDGIVRGNKKLTAFLELEAATRKITIDIVCRRLAESRSR